MNSTTTTAEPSDPRLERVVAKIRELRLEFPAKLFLELHLPVSTVFHTSFLFVQPLVSPLFGIERVQGLVDLFSERKNLEYLIARLEAEEA